MGIGPFHISKSSCTGSGGGYSTSTTYVIPEPKAPPNPNPGRFEILGTWEVNGFLIVQIKYPDCTNFEGDKILVYQGVSAVTLKRKKKIDRGNVADEIGPPEFLEDYYFRALVLALLSWKIITPDRRITPTCPDPHFCDCGKCLSPVARFAPTREGMDMAVSFCDNYDKFIRHYLDGKPKTRFRVLPGLGANKPDSI